MKVLSIVWFKVFPAKYGGQKGIVDFEEALANHCEVTCLCSINNEIEEATEIQFIPVLPKSKFQFINPWIIWNILQHVKKQKPDILLLEHPYHGIAGILAKKLYGPALVLHQHNLEYKRFKNLGKWWWVFLRWFEKAVSKSANMTLFKTAQELLQAVDEFGIKEKNCILVPYGIKQKTFKTSKDTDIYKRHRLPQNHKIILFAGTLDYKPNADAVEGIFNELAPLLQRTECTIVICGRNQLFEFAYLNYLHHPNVVMAGAVENIDRYFYSADVFINPVLSCGGLQTKVLDALSYHCPVISFEKALAGINYNLTGKIKAVKNNDWLQMATEIEQMILKEKTPVEPAFFEAYDWEKIVTPVVNSLKVIVDGKKYN